jgi:hypothetical protein
LCNGDKCKTTYRIIIMYNNISLLKQCEEYYYNNKNYTSTDNRHFALCESCFWSATIFKWGKKQEQIINTCPACFNENSISLIPLTRDEVYELSIRSKGGLEMKFSKVIKSPGY